jgi:antitoxin component of RelBE/YafQ-DinJ toxin-antitoxin module
LFFQPSFFSSLNDHTLLGKYSSTDLGLGSYIEAQIWGTLNLNEVKEIWIEQELTGTARSWLKKIAKIYKLPVYNIIHAENNSLMAVEKVINEGMSGINTHKESEKAEELEKTWKNDLTQHRKIPNFRYSPSCLTMRN